MEKKAQRKTYKDPAMNKIIQEKANWNKQVSALINDLIHFKKSVNGWPSKFYKERTRITQPVPVDLSGILSQIAGDFQDIASRGNSILKEQSEFSKAHLQRHTKRTLDRLEQTQGPTDVPKPTTAPAPAPSGGPSDLGQQLSKGLASEKRTELIKLAEDFELTYLLESHASNPFTRFVAKLFDMKYGYGFGEGARIRRLRMTMLDNCLSSWKTLKHLQAEIVKSSESSLENSHKMMTTAWNQWNIVNRVFDAYKTLKPEKPKETGGKVKNPERAEEGREAGDETGDDSARVGPETLDLAEDHARRAKDYKEFSPSIKTNSPSFYQLSSAVEAVMATPKDQRINALLGSGIIGLHDKAIQEVNAELGTNGKSFQEISQQYQSRPKKEAQELRGFLGKTRHQTLPGATSGSRLEIYNLIEQVKKDMDGLMNLLEDGFEREKIQKQIIQVNRQMSSIRTMVRALFYSVRPDKATYSFF